MIILTTCPRDCYDACGIAVVKRDGAIRKVRGDRAHPISRGALCGKCALAYNGVWIDPEARLTRPLVRAGAKGSGRFAAVTWEEALERTARGLERALAAAGPRSVLHAHYTGTCSVLAGEFPLRFFNRLGATEVEPDTICNNAGHVALGYVYGSSVTGFDPKSASAAGCIVVWGANPSASAPHAHKHWLRETEAKVVVIDPVRHDTAASADIHLQPFPGSDAALAFALMHVFQREGMVDRAFVDAHTVGWDRLEPKLDACTPEWAEDLTGVPARDIETVARLYARGPSLLWLGQGLQRQPRGGNVMRACALLPALTGNLGKPGVGLYYLNGAGPRNIDTDYVAAPHLRREPAETVSHMELAERLAEPRSARAFVCWNMNVAASGPRQSALRAALAREDLFTVVIDLFQTDTADLADVVLPAASFLEFDDLVVPYFHLHLSAQAKAAEPPGEALPNQAIFRRLAQAMGYTEPELHEPDRAILDRLLERSGLGIGFDTLKRHGTIDPFPEPQVQFQDLRFETPSGRVEIASERAAAAGHPAVPEPWADPRPAGGRLRLLSPAGPWQLNDSYGNNPDTLRVLGDATILMCAADARAHGLLAGQRVEVGNDTGRLELELAVSDCVPPGVALAHKGRWPKLEPACGNVNVLNPGRKSDMGESSSVHGVEVWVRAAGLGVGRACRAT